MHSVLASALDHFVVNTMVWTQTWGDQEGKQKAQRNADSLLKPVHTLTLLAYEQRQKTPDSPKLSTEKFFPISQKMVV